jgi:hypothetical protein
MAIKFSPIIPRPINVAGIQQALVRAMRDVGEEIREDFEDTTKTWNHKPVWEPRFVIPKVGIDSITVETSTEDKRYLWTAKGTKKHFIPQIPGKILMFPSEFIPKTFPGIINSGAGFSGGDPVFSSGHMHPGTEARNFDLTIAKNQKIIFKITLDRAMGLAAKASGHYMR